MTERREMRRSDWGNSAVNLVIGGFLGLVAVDFAGLLFSDDWLMAVIIVVLFSGVLLFDSLLSWFWDRVERIGSDRVAPRRFGRRAGGRKPLIRVLSLPAGFLVGMALSGVGLRDTVLGWL